MTDGPLAKTLDNAIARMHNFAADTSSARLVDEVISNDDVTRSKRSTVQIIAGDGEKPRGAGSGFFVNQGTEVVTNLHVIGNAKKIEIKTPGGETFNARVTRVDEFNDLALLQIDGISADPSRSVKLGQSDKLTGAENIFAVGHPNGVSDAQITVGNYKRTATYDQVQDKTDSDQWRQAATLFYGEDAAYKSDAEKFLAAPRLEAKLAIDHGNSGGPVLNARAETIGVATNVSPNRPGDSYLIPSEKVAALIDSSDKRFDFVYEKVSNFDKNPLETVAKDGALVAIGYKFKSVALPVIGAAYSVDLYQNLKMASSDNLYGNRNSYIGSAALDAAAVSGSVLSLFPKTRVLGFGMVGARALLDIGSDFVKDEPVLKKVVRHDQADPQRVGEPLYWSLIDRVNASKKQLAPSTIGTSHGLQMKRH
jgi:S1-C subfamily serine protease